MVRDLSCVDIWFIRQLIDLVDACKDCLLDLTRVGSSVLLLLVVFPVRVDSLGFTGSGFMSPQLLCIFSLFLIIYEHLTHKIRV